MLAVFLLILLIWLYLNGVRVKKLVTVGGVAVISAVVVVSPWIVRNYRVHQQFVFMSANSGFNFWTGNNPFTTGGGHEVYTAKAYKFMNKKMPENQPAIQEMHRYPLPTNIADQVATMDEVDLDRQFYRAGFEYIQQHPQEWLQLMWAKFKSFVWFRPNIGDRYDVSWTLYYKPVVLV